MPLAIGFFTGMLFGWCLREFIIRPKLKALEAQLKANQAKMTSAIKSNTP